MEYLPQYEAYGISDELAKRNIYALSLPKEAYERLGIPYPKSTIKIGFLMGREEDYYSVDMNYIRAICKTGAHIRFLTYEHPFTQLAGCTGLILPGGIFETPGMYLEESCSKEASLRANTYISLTHYALEKKIPILGIEAGARMVAGFFGYKIQKNPATTIDHAGNFEHSVRIIDGTPLAQIFGRDWIWAHSRHSESIIADSANSLQMYAFAPDGIPEAWGSKPLNILCVQWPPEVDESEEQLLPMQKIYNWIAVESKISAFH